MRIRDWSSDVCSSVLSPMGKAANEIRRRYALWFLCRRHAPPPIYRDLPTIVGLAGMIWRAIMSATAPLCAGSDQPRLAAAQRVDPRIGLPDLQAEQTGEVGKNRIEHRRRERHRLSDDARQRFQVQGETEDIDGEFHLLRKRRRRTR